MSRRTFCTMTRARGSARRTRSRSRVLVSGALAIFALLSGTYADAKDADPKGNGIVGGSEVPEGDWPSVVAVVVNIDAETQGLCTGVVVAPRLILTAAHCLDVAKEAADIFVLFGENVDEASQSGTFVQASEFGVHPDYCGTTEEDCWDLGYVLLEAPVSVGELIAPLSSQDEIDEALALDRPLRLVGFGQDENEVSGIKREVTTSIESYSKLGLEFFSGGDGKDSCLGDSGGPAFAYLDSGVWRLAGIVSRGAPECGDGGVYGNPLPALCWVRDATGVDIVPAGCPGCGCYELPAAPVVTKGSRCAVAGAGEIAGAFAWLLLLGGAIVRRRRCGSHARPADGTVDVPRPTSMS